MDQNILTGLAWSMAGLAILVTVILGLVVMARNGLLHFRRPSRASSDHTPGAAHDPVEREAEAERSAKKEHNEERESEMGKYIAYAIVVVATVLAVLGVMNLTTNWFGSSSPSWSLLSSAVILILVAFVILTIANSGKKHHTEGEAGEEKHHGFPWSTFFFYLPAVVAVAFFIYAYTVLVGISWFDHIKLPTTDRSGWIALGAGVIMLVFWFLINAAQRGRKGVTHHKKGEDTLEEEEEHHKSSGGFFPSIGTLMLRVFWLAVAAVIVGAVIYNWDWVSGRFQNQLEASEYQQTPKGEATEKCTGMLEDWAATTQPAKPGLGNDCTMAAKAKVPHTVAFIADNGKSYWSPGDVPDGYKVVFWKSKTGHTEIVQAAFCPPHSHWKGEKLGCR